MKSDLHPDQKQATVKCNGCDTTFETTSTVDKIEVEICSNCHPFYTGKQKLVDVAGRVDRFKAQQEKARQKQQSKKSPANNNPKQGQQDSDQDNQADLKDLKQQLEEE